MHNEIIPAVIPESFEDLQTKLARVQGLANVVQIDVTDGIFVLSRSWPMRATDKKSFEALVRGHQKLPFHDHFHFEVDMMVHAPEKYLADWVKIGIARAVFHVESKHSFSEITRILGGTVELGVALNPGTPIARLEPYLDSVDYVQVMGIETIGRQGEAFSERALSTLAELASRYPNVTLQVDGGVTDASGRAAQQAGASRLVSGSYIFRSNDPRAAIERLSQ